MHAPKIDFLKPTNEPSGLKTSFSFPRAKEGRRKHFLIVVFFLLMTATAVYINFGSKVEIGNGADASFSFIRSVRSLIGGADKQLQGEREGRINILLLGIGGAGHDGANLTDTIILASIDPKNKKVGMLSIPRDLLAPIPGYGYRRINNANAFAEELAQGKGGEFSKEVIGDLFGVKIHYYARADFKGFRKIVDDIGGVYVDVEKDFTDPLYPTEDFKTQTISFRAGRELMNGERALQYARSRHGTGDEGSDFARGKRQQKLLLGILEKLFSRGVLTNPSKLVRVYETLSSYASTDLETWELVRLAALSKGIAADSITVKTLQAEPEGPLVSKIIDGAFVLLPKSGAWDDVREIIKNLLNETPAEKKNKKIAIEIQNGTVIPGFAANAAELLKNSGYEVTKIGNAENRNYEKTIIYEKEKTKEYQNDLNKIKNLLDAIVSVIPLNEEGQKTQSRTTNFLIILGTGSLAAIQYDQ